MACFSNSNNGNNSVNSACALRKILNCLDNLNTQDLATLRDICDRILDSNGCGCNT